MNQAFVRTDLAAPASESSKQEDQPARARYAYRRALSATVEDGSGRTMSERLLLLRAKSESSRRASDRLPVTSDAEDMPNPMA